MAAVDEVLGAWRDGQRLLDELPPSDPDLANVRLAVSVLGDLHRELTAPVGESKDVRGHSLDDSVHAATDLIRATRERVRREQRLRGA